MKVNNFGFPVCHYKPFVPTIQLSFLIFLSQNKTRMELYKKSKVENKLYQIIIKGVIIFVV